MNKQEYLESIRSRISAMPADDVNRFMDYYSEMIDAFPRRRLWQIWDHLMQQWSRYLKICRLQSL